MRATRQTKSHRFAKLAIRYGTNLLISGEIHRRTGV